jgi:ferredoxin
MYDRRRQSALAKRHWWRLATCTVCGREFSAEQILAGYCSSSCRAKAWRARRKAEQLERER